MLCCLLVVAQTPLFTTLSGEEITADCLFRDRTAAAFVLLPDCDACSKVVDWLRHAAEAFPEVRFFLISPERTPEFAAAKSAQLDALIDPGGAFGAAFRVQQVPAILLMVSGANVARLDWPFTEGQLLRALAESLLVDVSVPDTSELRGEPAIDFAAVDLRGKAASLSVIQRPFLIAFLSLACTPCWEALAPLAAIAEEVPVALVTISGSENSLTREHSERLADFEQACSQGTVRVLIPTSPDVLEYYHLATSPTFLLVDSDGVIARIWEGREVIPQLRESLKSALESI